MDQFGPLLYNTSIATREREKSMTSTEQAIINLKNIALLAAIGQDLLTNESEGIKKVITALERTGYTENSITSIIDASIIGTKLHVTFTFFDVNIGEDVDDGSCYLFINDNGLLVADL